MVSFRAMMSDMEKLNIYVDESGQDTGGTYFVVVVVILVKDTYTDLEELLERIEHETGRRKKKQGESGQRRDRKKRMLTLSGCFKFQN